MQFKVLTWNIHKGFTALNREFVLEELRAAIRATHADAVFLQEVVGEHSKRRKEVRDWPTRPQFEFLADTVWPHYAYARNAVYPRGHHGNVILSRYPIVGHAHENISTNAFEQRGLLHCVAELVPAGRRLHLVCVHLGLTQRGRSRQIDFISRRIERHVPPDAMLVVAGDFNDWRGRVSPLLHERHGLLEAHETAHGRRVKTYPAAFPIFGVDRIYFRGMDLQATSCLHGRNERKLSDHAALAATFHVDKRVAVVAE